MGISLPGNSVLTGAWPSLTGVKPPPAFTGTPMGSGEFSGSGQPAARQAPPLHFGGNRLLPNRTTATITSHTAPAVTMASYGGVSTSTSLGRPIPSLGIAQNPQASAPTGQTQQQWSGAIHQQVQLPNSQGTIEISLDQALHRVFPGDIPAAIKQFIAPNTESDFGSFHKQSGRSPLDSVISLQQLRSDVKARYLDFQVEPAEPAPSRPTSLGLANFQQAKPEQESNLPLSPSLEAWLTCQAQTLEGKTSRGRCPGPLMGLRPSPNYRPWGPAGLSPQMPPLYWGPASFLRSGTGWSLTRTRSAQKRSVSLGRVWRDSRRSFWSGLVGCRGV